MLSGPEAAVGRLRGRSGQDRAILADQGRRMGSRRGSLLEEAAEVLGAERHVDDAVEVAIGGGATAADRERRPAGGLALERRADVGAGIAAALGLKQLALINGDGGIPRLAAGPNMSGRIRDPDRDRLLQGRLEPLEEDAGLGCRDLLPGHAMGAVLDPPDHELHRIEHLAGVLVQDRCRAGDGFLIVAQNLRPVPGRGGGEHDGRHEQRGDQQQPVQTDRGQRHDRFQTEFRQEAMRHNKPSGVLPMVCGGITWVLGKGKAALGALFPFQGALGMHQSPINPVKAGSGGAVSVAG